jgi:uncharacterized protein (DUF1501 family)
MNVMKRREFLKGLVFSTVCILPGLCLYPGRLAAAVSPSSVSGRQRRRVLILLELKGGNDGLNTIIPYGDPTYYRLRPNLAVPASKVVALDNKLGLHPGMKALRPIWDAGDLAIALGTGYPEPNRSHFRSIDIWNTASGSDHYLDAGWVSQIFGGASKTGNVPQDPVADGLVLGGDASGPLAGSGMRTLILKNPRQFIRQADRVSVYESRTDNPSLDHILAVQRDVRDSARVLKEKFKGPAGFTTVFPKNNLGRSLEMTAKLITSDVAIPVIKISHGSFDTHSRQLNKHQRLLTELADSIFAFRGVMREAGQWDRVLIMTYSEFGRRVRENGSGGTDHGTAAPHLLLGGRVKGGFYGRQPSLEDLDDGDLRYQMDYRSLYGTVAEDWWGMKADFQAEKPFPKVSFLKG